MSIVSKLLSACCVLVLVALVAVPFIQVVMRDLFGAPIIGAEEFTRFLLIVLVFTAFPIVVMQHENIVMGEFKAAMPRRTRAVLNLAISILAIAATGFIAYVTATNISRNLTNATPTLGIPFWIFLGATLFGFAGAAIVHLLHLRKPPQADTNIAV